MPPAKVHLWMAGKTISGFASFHGVSEGWAWQVINGKARAPARFRQALSEYVGLPEWVLFPGDP